MKVERLTLSVIVPAGCGEEVAAFLRMALAEYVAHKVAEEVGADAPAPAADPGLN